ADLSDWCRRHGASDAVRIYGKVEGRNPGGSVKDRPALSMVLDGLNSGRFSPGKTLLDSTSGNTGIAYAMIGAALGFPVRLCIPENASRERIAVLRAFGADLVLTDPLEGSDGAIVEARRQLEADPDRYWKPDQYNNPANPKAHAKTTAPEIWQQTDGQVTHVFASLGTSGTAMGLRQGFDEIAPDVQVVGVEPDHAFHGLEGLKHMASSIVPGIYDESRLDLKLPAGTEEAYESVQNLARETGLMTSPSGAAALNAAIDLSRQTNAGCFVVILPDHGTRYLTTRVWQSVLTQGGGI
ncbi:MAG: pyridoxal-phosphate dependent enzyme, partial [Candidatus Dadabacteria bacterium]